MQYATLQDHLGCGKRRALERVAALGLDGVELVVPDGIHDVGPHGMALDEGRVDAVDEDEIWSPVARENLRGDAADHGVAITSLCPSYLNFRPGLTATDAEEREAVVADLQRLVEAGADLTATVVLVPFFRDAEIRSAEQRHRVAEAIQPAVRTAETAGVTLALETSLPADENRALVEAIDSPRARLYYDVGNAAYYGYDPAEELRSLADILAPRIHLKDGTDGPADSPLGAGRVDFEDVAEAVRAIEYDEWLVFETTYEDDPEDAMRAHLRVARDHFE